MTIFTEVCTVVGAVVIGGLAGAVVGLAAVGGMCFIYKLATGRSLL